ncbi:MAG: hypothetical protein ABIO55_07730 [Ginsengibacter sp.]
MNSLIIPFGCFVFTNSLHLVYPFAPADFHKLLSLLRVHPSLWLASKGVLLVTGAPLDGFTSMLVRTFWRSIVSFCIGNNYRDLTAASLCVRLLQTHLLYRSPPCSLEQRSIQPV